MYVYSRVEVEVIHEKNSGQKSYNGQFLSWIKMYKNNKAVDYFMYYN